MLPTIQEKEYELCRPIRHDEIKRGDVVSAWAPFHENRLLLKRVVALVCLLCLLFPSFFSLPS